MARFEHSGDEQAQDELYRVRHSLAHVLAQAVLELRPGSTLGFGPPIRDGFYYDFVLTSPLTEDDFPELEKRMRQIIKKGQKFYREDLPASEALAARGSRTMATKRACGKAAASASYSRRSVVWKNGGSSVDRVTITSRSLSRATGCWAKPG